jgi:glycosyltransferase involved in cell wall biosynthesis
MHGPAGGSARAVAATAPRRILITDATQGGVLGGSLTGVLELIAHVDRARWEPSLVLFETKPVVADLEKAGVRVHVLPPVAAAIDARGAWLPRRAVASGLNLWRGIVLRARQLLPILRAERPDLVYCSSGIVPSLPFVAAAALCRFPVICHFKGFGRPGPLARFMARFVDTAVFMTDELAEHVRARNVRFRRCLTVFDGIDPVPCPPGAGAAVRREFGIPADAPLVGVVGHIQGWKGQLLAAEAVARARRRIPDLRCLVVGGVHRLGAEYAERLRARVAEPDLAGQVVLTGARRDVLACMEAMDVVLHTSDREPFGRVIIEAMAASRPVIAPREGGPTVIVVDGETGLLVPPRDPDALATAIVALIADPARRREMGRAGRARVEAVFSIREHVRAMERVFDDVVARHARSVPAT